MTQIPILSGVLPTKQADFNTRLPLNLEPEVIDSRISKGQLRMAWGAVAIGNGPGVDRGGHLWEGAHYRVMGTQLVQVDQTGSVAILGDVGGTGQVGFDHSFDRLAIRSGDKLWYYDRQTLAQVTDEDLGPVVDHVWIDGYFMLTDGKFVLVTELTDPFEVKPLKYGSAEADPDPIVGLVKVRGEAYVVGRYTIELLQNVGGNGFPFTAVRSATIPFGAVDAGAITPFAQTFAFVGSERDGALGVYVAGQGSATRISSRLIDDALAACSQAMCASIERRHYSGKERLIVHLGRRSYCYLADASRKAGEPVWYELESGGSEYRVRNAVVCGDRVYVGDTQSNAVGYLSPSVATHFGAAVDWRFDVGKLYAGAMAWLLNKVEIVGVFGRAAGDAFFSATRDGEIFSMERARSMGAVGDRGGRVQWRPRLRFPNYAGLRFRGRGAPLFSVVACEVEAEQLQ